MNFDTWLSQLTEELRQRDRPFIWQRRRTVNGATVVEIWSSGTSEPWYSFVEKGEHDVGGHDDT